jgi:hypothetical protein
VETNVDALITAIYVTIDDFLGPRRGRGRKPQLSDAELVCLAVAQVLLGCPSEHRWLRFAYGRLGHLFPYLPQPPGYNKRIRAHAPVLNRVMAHLATVSPSWCDSIRLFDATALPCGASRETVKRSALREIAGYGYCASHSRYYWGLKLYLLTAPDGMPIAWCLANPKLGEREVAQALWDPSSIEPGQVILCDKGFSGDLLEDHAVQLGARLVRPDRKGEKPRFGPLAPVRQWVESVFDTLKGQLSLEQHGGRTPAGVFARVAQRLLALAAGIWHNWLIGAPNKRSLIAYDH